ncbi:MAG: trimethylamine methyltransferase family protein [Myxococcales bacterium]|nr:trimethylamine methyltransferase family protein [Myxococcales bacterium]MDH5565500.1 trimethylamine methyltransferase family protein [Myxococcales bacterium]
MAHARMTFLNEREADLIHEQSIRSLGEIGVKIQSREVLRLLEQNGAGVDYGTMIAKIPQRMIAEALEAAPKQFALCARNPEHDLPLPSHPYPHATTSGLAINVTDRHTGEYRKSTLEDAREFAKLGDALGSVDFLWTSLTANDVVDRAHGPHELWATLQNTSKHVQGVTVQSAEDARVQIELAALVAGGSEALRKRPLMSVISCPIAPLSFEEGAIEAQVEFARAGVPICSMSMSMSGLTAPVTVAGTIVNANTENLASLVITQSACPGSPHIYTSESAPMNMRTGAIDYSALEKTLISIGLGQMARRYRLPCLVADIGFGDAIQGNIGSFSDLAVQFLGIASYTDILTGMGCVDSAKGVCFEQLVIDSYIWACVREFLKEVEIAEDRIGLEAVAAVGQGHHFLSSRHTVRYMRDEITQWDEEKLKLLGSDPVSLIEKGRSVADQLLRDHRVQPIDADLIRQGDDLIHAYEGRLAA